MRRHDDRQRVLVLWLALPGLGLAAGCDDDPGGDPVDMAVVQDGPLMMDGHMPDMAIDATVDAGEGDAGDVGTGPATCEVQCGRLADCAAGDGCPGYTAENRDGIMTACLQTCTPMLAEVVAGMATCPPVLELARTASADFAAGCNPLPCEEARDRVIDCLLEDVPVDLCPNLGPGERDAVIAHLDRAGLTCPDAAFALNVRAVRPTCAAVVEAHLGDPSRSAMCQGVTLSPACDAVGARVATCALAACPALAPWEAELATVNALDCQGVADGRWTDTPGGLTPAQVATLVNADTPCDDRELQPVMDRYFRDTAFLFDGWFIDFCGGAAPQPAERCAAACARLDACGFPGSWPFRADTCQFMCETHGHAGLLWDCVDDAATCTDVVTCGAQGFGLLDPPADEPVCEAVGAALAACYLEACPAMASIGALADGYMEDVCQGQLQAPGVTVAGLEAAFAGEVACDDPEIALTIDILVERTLLTYDGLLAATCEAGPVVPVATCEAACARIGDCEGVGGAERCAFICVQEAVYAESWPCIVAQPEGATCEEMEVCFP